MNNNNDLMSWDDDITCNGSSFTLLLPGTYEGVITKIEKKRETRPGKMQNYNYAEITITVNDDGNGNRGIVKNRLYLSHKLEFKIAEFLEILGLKKKDEIAKAYIIDKALGKNVRIVVTCDYKNSVTNTYHSLDKEQLPNALKEGVKVFNSVKKYEPSTLSSDNQNSQEDGFNYNFDQFGYEG